MDWIKKHYDQFALGLITVMVLVFAILLYLKTQSFGDRFTDALSQPAQGDKVPPIVLDQIDRAYATLAKPPAWVVNDPEKDYSLFVSSLYMLGPNGEPVRPRGTSNFSDSLTGTPIPNTWFMEHSLPLFDTAVRFQDPDGDGFPNEVEFRWKTDPNNKESHPPYYAMLFLKQIIRVPFRLRFDSYDGDPKKGNFKDFSFGINTIDVRLPSEFPKLGEMVTGTKFKLEKFEYKTRKNPKTGEDEDVSELTLINTETNDKVVLVLNQIVDSPDYYILFDYQWPSPAQPPLHAIEFKVKKLGYFVLRPNIAEKDRYKLIDIKENAAVIQLPEGQKAADGGNTVEITPDPRKK